ncbi:hypothetical protein CFAM422_008595 [Trichoderma lentiforme]|uniref:Uncharacterized protein n=1 Tax=Trichoderma lentiforme TaxID=1567552 RepID=A0A9P4XBL7_9HYPO|nr:hypothetical protein CFAM422_008595 [Trichoderma lentiforme]
MPVIRFRSPESGFVVFHLQSSPTQAAAHGPPHLITGLSNIYLHQNHLFTEHHGLLKQGERTDAAAAAGIISRRS